MDSTVEVTWREDGTLLAITASVSIDEGEMEDGPRLYHAVAVPRSLLVHAHNDLEMLAEKAPDHVPDDMAAEVPPTE